MVQKTAEELAEELARLTAANAELTRALDQERERSTTDSEKTAEAVPHTRPPRRWGRTLLAATLIAVGVLLSPVAVVSTWAHRQLTDTAYFVDTFAPLAKDPAVQGFVADQVIAAIESQIDIDRIADDLFAGLQDLDVGPRAQEALALLQAPAVSGIRSLMETTVTGFITSDAFAAIWADALEFTHRQLVNTATGREDAAITIGAGQVELQLEPIIRAVKDELIADGFPLADRIPTISRSIVIAEGDSVGLYLAVYHLVVAIGVWVPWLMLITLVAGVLSARSRARAAAWASGAVLVMMLLLGVGVDAGRNVFALAVASAVPHDAALAVYSEVLGFVASMTLALGTLSAAVLVIALLAGPSRWALGLRQHARRAISAIRSSAEAHGYTTGVVGERVERGKRPLRILIGAACAAFILLMRPLTPGMIVGTAIIGVGALAVLELLSRPAPVPTRSAPSTSEDLSKEIRA
ncbi:hypothetical protein CQ047_05345 [Microbacterium sp. MYb72]|uniref:hypothetical protein n=1 Tax=Microbacterium sp. MYb72 TaxID=1848693 RepID=UPI000CFE1197|nr:hypothetical protein [Microbacterium sp. MYb72]PRB10899.1 hypothetical protein CQ047_05345 [Microbacterium sp. MYb72]